MYYNCNPIKFFFFLNCIKIISDKSNSAAMFLRIQTDIYLSVKLGLLMKNVDFSNRQRSKVT